MIDFRNMIASEFINFRADTITKYAEERVGSGDWDRKDAMQLAQDAFDTLLPSGLATTGNYIWNLFETKLDRVIGTLWIQIRQRGIKRNAHILSLIVYKQFRRRGFARQTMLLLEDKMLSQEFEEITLNVFGHNEPAIELYKSLGFEITQMNMTKPLRGDLLIRPAEV